MTVLAKFASNRKWVWIILAFWVIAAGALSLAPSANDVSVNTSGDDLPADAPSVMAQAKLNGYFPDGNGMAALLVFTEPKGWNNGNIGPIEEISKWLAGDNGVEGIAAVIPFHELSEPARAAFFSEDRSTLMLPVILESELEMAAIKDAVTAMQENAEGMLASGTLHITGPAGIASDTIAIFSNADLVLLFATIALVLVLLIAIYRSPLLAIIPLAASAFVYQIVNKLLGLFAANGAFALESQSVSIVSILLFGATTDYCLFVFSRFREELRKRESKHESMELAMKGIAEPLFFSGGTVLAAMLVLFLADYGPYRNFAPVFSIAIAVVLLAGLTLIPALFTLVGRRSFWPVIPKVGDQTLEKNRFWGAVGGFVTRRPALSGGLVLLILLANGLNVLNINYSFNLIKSFPEDMTSRVGYEQLEKSFPAGELAPVSVLLERRDGAAIPEQEAAKLPLLDERLRQVEGVRSTGLNGSGEPSVAADGEAIGFSLTLDMNPYDQSALDTVDELRALQERLLADSGLPAADYALYFAGETAKQADIRALNDRDTKLVVGLVSLVLLFMLVVQTRSLIAPVYMMATILVSYLSAMGFGALLFESAFGYEGMSYRIPLYAFVFLVALGVDYNIMLISRIREENREHPIREAVRRGVALTGGVISSAGLILAATFGVLMTQPILELFMFGFIVCAGILIDAFLVRGVLVPAIAALLGSRNWWPSKNRLTDRIP